MSDRSANYTTSSSTSGSGNESSRTCRQLIRKLDSGGHVTETQLVALAQSTARELSRGISKRELVQILCFLLQTRVTLDSAQEASFQRSLDQIARSLAPRISRNGDEVWSPFARRQTTGRDLRNRFFQEALRAGQVDVATAFA